MESSNHPISQTERRFAGDHGSLICFGMRGTGIIAFALKQNRTHSATIPKIAKNATNIIDALTFDLPFYVVGLWLDAVTGLRFSAEYDQSARKPLSQCLASPKLPSTEMSICSILLV
jgi:hypothetical protein